MCKVSTREAEAGRLPRVGNLSELHRDQGQNEANTEQKPLQTNPTPWRVVGREWDWGKQRRGQGVADA